MSGANIPPPYTAVTRHEVFPQVRHDEAARFNFLAGLNPKMFQEILAQGNLSFGGYGKRAHGLHLRFPKEM